ncbi:ThiF family adenylyltransferase [Allosphingosinicella sp.]|uniref:ThiF family adenylyltransferase n=1 Tax=Allosphingosinicella sp. TaxID=2823234 RepID=UPI00378365A3
MPDHTGGDAADQVLRVALDHPECMGGELVVSDSGTAVRLDIRVGMPLHFKPDGVSATGVRAVEPVLLTLPVDYPWQSPRVTLRQDFPRNFPHLQPGPASALPRPCLIEGDQNEFFLQFGLVESGVYQLVEQVAVWLRKAAINDLIDPVQGWEPMLRRSLADVIELDAEAARRSVTRQGGFVAWTARFRRLGDFDSRPANGAWSWLTSGGEKTPLANRKDSVFTASPIADDFSTGNTIVGVVWPDKEPSGAARVSDTYRPEDVVTLGDLRARAADFGCSRGLESLLRNLERCFADFTLPAPIPVGIVLCVRRPVHLIGSTSDIELLPYVVEIRPMSQRKSLFPGGDAEGVGAAMHLQSVAPSLLRELAGAPERPSLAMLGCGSVGSKLAVHAARSGQDVVSLSDEGILRPHNLARHALFGDKVGDNKAEALAVELRSLGYKPDVHKGNLAADLRDVDIRKAIIPPAARAVINATASLSVREALVGSTKARDPARQFEVGLFGRGRVAYLLADGKQHNPTHADLMAELYATVDDNEVQRLMHDPEDGLAEIQIGQGCGSLTMKVDDAQLSMMAAGLSKEISRALDAPRDDGSIVLGLSDAESPATCWSRQLVPPFETVPIEGSDGWELRISARVVERIRAEVSHFARVETGGVMIGLTSARLKTVTVVDLLDAPPDSTRSATLFVLGTQGLQAEIERRHAVSGGTLFDVGTWHSHLQDEGPSSIDWSTAAALAAERVPPAILLITSPKRFYALISPAGSLSKA